MDHAELSTVHAANDSVMYIGLHCAIVGKDGVNVVCQGEVNNCYRLPHYLLHLLHRFSHYWGRMGLTPDVKIAKFQKLNPPFPFAYGHGWSVSFERDTHLR